MTSHHTSDGHSLLERKAKAMFALTRPFTLLPLILGVLSGSASALGSAWYRDASAELGDQDHVWESSLFFASLSGGQLQVFSAVGLGAICAALVNGASNIINQIYDLDIDRINKPKRPLCTGEVSLGEAWVETLVLYVVALVPTWFITVPLPETFDSESLVLATLLTHQTTFVMIGGIFFSLVYSVPMLGRTKEMTFGANISIAIARGLFLRLLGWSTVASVFHVEPWFIGGVFGCFLLGAATTKDFSDIEGDAAFGSMTIPVVFGVETAAKMIAPFFILPWLLLPIGANIPDPLSPDHTILTGNPVLISALGFGLAVWGAYVVRLILKDPDAMAKTENHPSWTQMYLMVMAAQIGLAISYLF